MEFAALISKHTLTLINRRLEVLCSVNESTRVKSGAWGKDGVFIYTTSNHIKYALIAGDYGIIRTLDVPVYILAIRGDKLYCLNREAAPVEVAIDPTEYRFKLALINRHYDEVVTMVRSANLVGQSIIAYLQKKGYPEVALHFVKDEKTRFGLALECGNLDVALEAAKILDDKAVWEALGEAALMQGNHQVVEMSYQRTKDFEKLAFLYLITGNMEKLQKMLKIAQIRKDMNGQYQTALFLGDIGERIRVLKEVGQTSLAYLTAATHGFKEESDQLESELLAKGMSLPPVDPNARLMIPPPPIRQMEENWPLLTMSRGPFDPQLLASAKTTSTSVNKTVKGPTAFAHTEEAEEDMGAAWGDDDLLLDEEGNPDMDEEEMLSAEGGAGEDGGWDVDEDLVIPADIDTRVSANEEDGFYAPPTRGQPPVFHWPNNSRLVADHVLAGSFDSAARLLQDQLGITHIEPFKQQFLMTFARSRTAFEVLPTAGPNFAYPLRNWQDSSGKSSLPAIGLSLGDLANRLQNCYHLTTTGKFGDAIDKFRHVLLAVPLLVVDSKQEVTEARQLIDICREYIIGLLLETARKEMPKDSSHAERSAEMAAYFTHCQLQPVHRILTLRTAINLFFKLKQMKTCASFCRRLLELGPKAEVAAQIRKVLTVAEKDSSDPHKLNYDEFNPFVVCPRTFVALYRGKPQVGCPFCGASYQPEFKGQICNVCEVAEIGRDAVGLRISVVQSK
ncbi:hypothetical protein AB6A40_003968 [Gnathostoma spinigerum]|uniref:Coatomer subunit alpha n=1 Tax=Gnathostoma spinigerum TaxID=75299 RepID=A0ABD6EGJ7_9BILA